MFHVGILDCCFRLNFSFTSRLLFVYLPIYRDAAQVHDAGRREEYVAAVVQVADQLPEHPAAQDRERRFECHREESHEDVRTG